MDLADRAQEGIDDALADALADRKRKNRPSPPLEKEGAGGRLDPGLCTDCEEPIDPRRLKAQPDATRCIDCQNEFERSRR